MKPSKKALATLADKMSRFIAEDALVKAHTTIRDALKLDIQAIANAFPSQFNQDGEWDVYHPDAAEKVGTLKQVWNKPQLLVVDSEQKPTPNQLATLIGQLDSRYLVQQPDVKLMLEMSAKDKDLKKALKLLGLEVTQKRRFDIKP